MLKKEILQVTAVFLSLSVIGCGPTVGPNEGSEVHYAAQMPQEWRVQCVGGKGVHSDPIQWIFTSWNSSNGRVKGKVIDRDGFINTFDEYGVYLAIRPVYFNEIKVNGNRAPITNDFKRFQLDIDPINCPAGLVGDRMS